MAGRQVGSRIDRSKSVLPGFGVQRRLLTGWNWVSSRSWLTSARPESLAAKLKLHPAARGTFDALVAWPPESDRDAIRQHAESALFLDRAKPSYIGGMLEMCNARLYGFWGSLTEALRTGKPQNEVKRRRRFRSARSTEIRKVWKDFSKR